MGSHLSGSHVSGSQWRVHLLGALNWGPALLHLGVPAWSTTHGPVAELTLPDPPFAPCLRILFSFALTSLSCRHRQGSDCLECCCLTHRGKNKLSCWSVGPWAKEQKRKMVLMWGCGGQEKPGSQMTEKSVVCSAFEWSYPCLAQFTLFPRLQEHPPTRLPTPPSLTVRVGRGLLTWGISGPRI